MAGERVRAFVPAPLRAAPRLVLDGTLQKHLEQATLALGRLDGVSLSCLIARSSYYVCEKGGALVSARTTSSRSSTVSADAGRVPRPRQRQAAGEFRKSQNWIGGTRPGNAIFVPPPHTALESAMSDLERFLRVDDDGLPLLARAGIAHVQFETIHPFLDGNGRVGRLLITLLFCSAGVLREPLLYLSLYLKKHRTKYYELLDGVRRDGDWEALLSFFFDGVRETSASAVTSAHAMSELFRADREKVALQGRRSGSALRVHDALKARPISTLAAISRATALSFPAAASAVELLVSMNIVRELTGRRRNRIFVYDAFLDQLNDER